MIKSIINNKKFLVIFIIIILLLVGYYIYYKNNIFYKESNTTSEINEVLADNDNEEIDAQENKNEIKQMIIVHITGEVKNWGVIELEENSRIIDAVNKAGGFTENADVEKINLAYVLTDGVKIYIPSKEDYTDNNNFSEQQYITKDSGDNVIMEEKAMKQKETQLVNINMATQTELETLPGIGPSIALKIISYRKENGNFSSIEDIKNVSGIGDNKFNSIKDLICI